MFRIMNYRHSCTPRREKSSHLINNLTMKKIFYIFMLSLGFSTATLAQAGGGKIREKMLEYVSEKLSLTSTESEKFNPVFLNYIREEHQTNQENKEDKLVL